MARDRRSSINDRRSGRRQDLRYAARIESLTDGTEIPCTLVDVSQTGARLLAREPEQVPDELLTVLQQRVKAASLSAETRDKLRGWRGDALKQLFAAVPVEREQLVGDHGSVAHQVIVEALQVADELVFVHEEDMVLEPLLSCDPVDGGVELTGVRSELAERQVQVP